MPFKIVQRFFALASLVSVSIASISIAAVAQTSRTEAAAPAVPGPYSVLTAEYKFPASVDADVLKTAATELWARAFWPTDLSKPRPIVFLLHGNHSTCGEGNPRIDSDCTYTYEGTCPTGQVVTPNHEGYNYLGQQLASLGYIAVTINANRGITCGAGTDADWGLNLARGRLVLRHIEEWMHWATAGGAPASLGTGPDAFLGKIDFTNVGLMGHSRGGEGMRAALAQYRDAGSIWPARIPNLKIRGIFEIGSVDGQAGRVLDADDTAWNQILPMCDGDVSDLRGRLPFERMLKKTTEARKTPKSLTMVYGANHNFFNTEWKTDESQGCFEHKEIHGAGPVSQNQQTVAAIEISAFMLANVGADKQPEMGRLFDPSYLVPGALTSITRIDRDHVYTFDRTYSVVVDDFDQPTGTSSCHKMNGASGIKVSNEITDVPSRAKLSWTSPSRHHFMQLNWEDKGQGRDVSGFTSLDLRVGRPEDVVKEAATEFSIALVDSNNKLTKAVLSSRFADITGPGTEEVDLYQTLRIPLAEFAVSPGAKIRGVRLIFDRSPKGKLNFANVRFSANTPLAFVGSLNQPLAPLSIIPTPTRGGVTPPAPPNDDDENENLAKAAAVAAGDHLPVSTPTPAPTPETLSAANAVLTDGLGQFGVGPSPMVSAAVVLRVHDMPSSRYLSGNAGVEVSVGPKNPRERFPVEAQLPTLVMNGNRFSVSRFASSGRTDILIFTLPKADYANLPDQGAMYLQYGRTNARKFWRMPNYNKAEMPR